MLRNAGRGQIGSVVWGAERGARVWDVARGSRAEGLGSTAYVRSPRCQGWDCGQDARGPGRLAAVVPSAQQAAAARTAGVPPACSALIPGQRAWPGRFRSAAISRQVSARLSDACNEAAGKMPAVPSAQRRLSFQLSRSLRQGPRASRPHALALIPGQGASPGGLRSAAVNRPFSAGLSDTCRCSRLGWSRSSERAIHVESALASVLSVAASDSSGC